MLSVDFHFFRQLSGLDSTSKFCLSAVCSIRCALSSVKPLTLLSAGFLLVLYSRILPGLVRVYMEIWESLSSLIISFLMFLAFVVWFKLHLLVV